MIDCTTLLLVHNSDEFFDLKFSTLEILIIKFESYESVTEGGVSVIDLNDIFHHLSLRDYHLHLNLL